MVTYVLSGLALLSLLLADTQDSVLSASFDDSRFVPGLPTVVTIRDAGAGHNRPRLTARISDFSSPPSEVPLICGPFGSAGDNGRKAVGLLLVARPDMAQAEYEFLTAPGKYGIRIVDSSGDPPRVSREQVLTLGFPSDEDRAAWAAFQNLGFEVVSLMSLKPEVDRETGAILLDISQSYPNTLYGRYARVLLALWHFVQADRAQRLDDPEAIEALFQELLAAENLLAAPHPLHEAILLRKAQAAAASRRFDVGIATLEQMHRDHPYGEFVQQLPRHIEEIRTFQQRCSVAPPGELDLAQFVPVSPSHDLFQRVRTLIESVARKERGAITTHERRNLEAHVTLWTKPIELLTPELRAQAGEDWYRESVWIFRWSFQRALREPPDSSVVERVAQACQAWLAKHPITPTIRLQRSQRLTLRLRALATEFRARGASFDVRSEAGQLLTPAQRQEWDRTVELMFHHSERLAEQLSGTIFFAEAARVLDDEVAPEPLAKLVLDDVLPAGRVLAARNFQPVADELCEAAFWAGVRDASARQRFRELVRSARERLTP